jgi:hypothetical protein
MRIDPRIEEEIESLLLHLDREKLRRDIKFGTAGTDGAGRRERPAKEPDRSHGANP